MTAAVMLRRGLLVGLLAGVVAGTFLFVVGEPSITQALRYEVVPPGETSVEVFSRSTQRLGLLAATCLYGVGLGGIFGLLYALVGMRLRAGSAWQRSLRLAAACFAAVWLVPFLKYPSNPPAVGDPATVGLRTRLYLTMTAVSVVAMAGAWLASRRLAERGVDTAARQVLVAAGYVAVVGAVYWLLPANPDPIAVPAEVIWSTRLTSAAGQALLWAGVGTGFGWLSQQAEHGVASRGELVGG